jgi:glycosyltransferase involved in cell wall biosynthesis
MIIEREPEDCLGGSPGGGIGGMLEAGKHAQPACPGSGPGGWTPAPARCPAPPGCTGPEGKVRLLLCMPDMPFPARKNGFRIRYAPVLEFLSRHCDVHALVIADEAPLDDELALLSDHVARVSLFVRDRSRKVGLGQKILRRLTSLVPGNRPFPMRCYDSAEIDRFVERETRGERYDVALMASINFAEVVRDRVRASRYVLDAMDSAYVFFLRREPRAWLNWVDTPLLRYWERSLVAQMDYASFVSGTDLRLLLGDRCDPSRVGVMPNGIYLEDYDDSRFAAGNPVIGFLGNMSYPPNVEAAIRLARIHAALRREGSRAELWIIGRSPADAVVALGRQDGVTVTGTVDNVWKYINSVDVFVFPMMSGAGQQNKLLEAMYAGVPVVSTAIGNGGVGAVPGESILLGESDEDMAAATVRLLGDEGLRQAVGGAGQRFVRATYSWPAIFARMKKHYLGLSGAST